MGLDPVEIEATVHMSRSAAGDVPFARAVERAEAKKVCIFGGTTLIDDCAGAWTPSVNVTGALVTGIVGNCNQLTIAGGFTTGVIAYKNVATLDLSAIEAIGFLIKSDTTLAAGVLQIGWSETAAMGGSPVYLDIPAVTAGKWYWVSLAFSGATSLRNAVLSIGLNAVSDPGAVVLLIDEVRAGALFYGLAGVAKDDKAKENDKAELYEDVTVLRGRLKVPLDTGITCRAEQKLYPIPGSGKFTTTEIVIPGIEVVAAEDQAKAAGNVEVIV